MSNESTAIISDIDLDDWEDAEDAGNAVSLVQSLDSRRRVENKLDDLRLRRETSEYDFGF
jgi:hypothetical protein